MIGVFYYVVIIKYHYSEVHNPGAWISKKIYRAWKCPTFIYLYVYTILFRTYYVQICRCEEKLDYSQNRLNFVRKEIHSQKLSKEVYQVTRTMKCWVWMVFRFGMLGLSEGGYFFKIQITMLMLKGFMTRSLDILHMSLSKLYV